MKMRIFLVVLATLAAAFMGCKEAPTVNPEDLTGYPNTGTRPGYDYPLVTAVYPQNGETDIPTDSNIVALFNMSVEATTLTYPNITVNASVSRTGTTVLADNTITGLSNTDDLIAGMEVSGAGIASGTTITSIPGSTSVRISDNATADGTVTINFSLDLTEGAVNDYQIVTGTNTAEVVFNPFLCGTALSPIPAGFSITLGLTAGIMDDATAAIPLNNPGSYTFTVGDSPDETAPQVIAGSVLPASGATNVPLNAANGLVIRIGFNEDTNLDASSINEDTIYLELIDGAVTTVVPCSYTYDSINKRIVLTPQVNLQPDTATTSYRVTVTTGIEDMSGNALVSGYSWMFQTVTTPLDDDIVGAPTITGPVVPAVTQTQAQVSWSTDEPTNHALHYGRGDDVADASHTYALYDLYHTVVLGTATPALVAGKRYYAQVDFEDIAGNAGVTAPATPLEFNTITAETAHSVHTGALKQSGGHAIPDLCGTYAGGLFTFWTNTSAAAYTEIYGQQYDTAMGALWNGASPMPLFTGASYTYMSAAEDGTGGVILVVTGSVSGIRAKRVYDKRVYDSSAILPYFELFNWGAGTTTAAGTGLSIDTTTASSRADVVPVYTGMFTKIRTGLRAEMLARGLSSYPFFDHDRNFITTLPTAPIPVVNGDIIMDDSDHVSPNGTTIVFGGVSDDFINILGQGANIIEPGDNYYIGDASNPATFTATNHRVNTGTGTYTDYTNGTNKIYTPNSYVLPTLWTMGDDDIVRRDTNNTYGRIGASGLTTHSTSSITSGTASVNVANRLIDMSKNFNSALSGYSTYWAKNIEASSAYFDHYTQITAISSDGYELTLAEDIFPNGNEDYEIYGGWCGGTADQAAVNHLIDLDANFLPSVAVNDIVVNTSTWTQTTVTAANSDSNLTLTANIFTSGTEPYIIVKPTVLASGNASAYRTGYLVDWSRDFSSYGSLDAGDMACTASLTCSNISAIGDLNLDDADHDLHLAQDIFPLGTEAYNVYNNVDSGTCNRASANILVDVDVDFSVMSITDGVDVVRNLTDVTDAVINGHYDGYLLLDSDIFDGGEQYQILHPLISATCNGDTIITELLDYSYNFITEGAVVGDVVYRVANTSYYTISSIFDYFGTNNAINFSESVNFDSEDYILYHVLSTGNTSDNNSGSVLVDTANATSWATIGTGDVVVNTTSHSGATVTADITTGNMVRSLSSNIFPSGNEAYKILEANTSIVSGNANADMTNHLIDMDVDFVPLLPTGGGQSYRARNASNQYTAITAISSDGVDLTLAADLFPNGNEAYSIYQYSGISGNAEQGSIDYLLDNSVNFIASGVTDGDIVINLTDDTATVVSTGGVYDHVLVLDNPIFDNGNEAYEIVYKDEITNGTANCRLLNSLVSYTVNFNTLVQVDDLVQNTGTGRFAVVDAISATGHILTLVTDGIGFTAPSPDIFPLGDGTENYAIYRQWDRYNATDPAGTFYEITTNWNMNCAAGNSITAYDYLNITGTADTPAPTRPLYDNDADFTAATAVSNGDIVVDVTNFSSPSDPNVSTVTTATYPIHARALDLTNDIFGTSQHYYEILRLNVLNTTQSDIVDTGVATGGAGILTASAPVWGTGSGLVHVGDVAYNITDNDYAMISAVADTSLSLDRDASFTNGDYYLILRRRGALFVWQEGATVHGRITKMEQSSLMNLVAEFTIAADGIDPHAISDDLGNAIVVYTDSAGEIWAVKLNGVGAQVWAPLEIDTQTANAETILDVQTDSAGGAVILYRHGNDLHAQRISAAGGRLWAATGRTFDNDGATTVTSEEMMVYDPATATVALVANVDDDIWACSRGGSSWGPVMMTSLTGSVQQNPQIYLAGADTIITWDDNRFLSNAGYGVFGIKINGSTGAKNATWTANDSGTNDYNGIAFVLSNYNEFWPNSKIVSYNGGADAVLVWEDYRVDGEDCNLVYEDITFFAP